MINGHAPHNEIRRTVFNESCLLTEMRDLQGKSAVCRTCVKEPSSLHEMYCNFSYRITEKVRNSAHMASYSCGVGRSFGLRVTDHYEIEQVSIASRYSATVTVDSTH